MTEFAAKTTGLTMQYLGIPLNRKAYALGGGSRFNPTIYPPAASYYDKEPDPGLDIEIPAGRLTGLVGRNGAGKTTLMRILAGQIMPTSGEVDILGGGAPYNNLAVLKRVVYMQHDMPVSAIATQKMILDNFERMFDSFDRDLAERILEYFKLDKKKRYSELSLGMKSVFSFTCGLACHAELTLFDEPVIGMDVPARRAFNEILLRDYSDYPRSIIISSHLLDEIENILYDVIVLESGDLVLHEPLDELRQSSYMVSGETSAVDKFTRKRRVVYYRRGALKTDAALFQALTGEDEREARRLNIELSAVSPENLCMYLTGGYNERGLNKIWNAQN